MGNLYSYHIETKSSKKDILEFLMDYNGGSFSTTVKFGGVQVFPRSKLYIHRIEETLVTHCGCLLPGPCLAVPVEAHLACGSSVHMTLCSEGPGIFRVITLMTLGLVGH